MSSSEIIAALIGIWLFSRWQPIKINYFKDSPNSNQKNREVSSGGSYIKISGLDS